MSKATSDPTTIGGHAPGPKALRIFIKPALDGPWLVCDEWGEAADMMGPGEEYVVKLVEMTDAEVDALGDFNGW